MANMSSLFAVPVPPNPETSQPADRRAWMVSFTRLYTRGLALEHIVRNCKDHWLQVEQFEAVMGHGFVCKATPDEIITCANEEWRLAEKYAANFLDALRKKLWPMCRARMPEAVVIAAADALQMEWQIAIDDEHLMPVIKGIWDAAQPRPARRGWRGAK